MDLAEVSSVNAKLTVGLDCHAELKKDPLPHYPSPIRGPPTTDLGWNQPVVPRRGIC